MTTRDQAEQLERAMALHEQWLMERRGLGSPLDAFLAGYGCGVADSAAERCAYEGCDHRKAKHAGDLCLDCLSHYAAPVMGLAAHAFAALAEGEKKP